MNRYLNRIRPHRIPLVASMILTMLVGCSTEQ